MIVAQQLVILVVFELMFLFVSEKQYECFETANRCVDADPGGTNLVCNGENDCGSFEVNISQFTT